MRSHLLICEVLAFMKEWMYYFKRLLKNMSLCSNMLSSGPISSLPTHKRSPTRRSKSRWEPIPEEKLVEKIASVGNEPVKDANRNQISETERMVMFDLLYFLMSG